MIRNLANVSVFVKTQQDQLAGIKDWPVRTRQAKYRAAQLTAVCGVHRRTLERYFRQTFGKPPKLWTEEQRQRELESLLQTDCP